MPDLLSINAAPLTVPTVPVSAAAPVICDELTLPNLLRVITGENLALRCPQFYPLEVCSTVAERLVRHPRGGFYTNAPQIGRVGMAYFEVIDDDSRARYYRDARQAIKELRAALCPFQNPMDHLRLLLAETWPGGAAVEAIEGEPMFVGLARVFTKSAEALPHQDVLGWDAPPKCLSAKNILAQLAANIYVQPSERGGELELWPTSLDRDQYEARKIPDSYGLNRAKLPPAAASVKPEKGDLILFNANKTHAVRPVTSGIRVTISCFIGVRSLTGPLSMWS